MKAQFETRESARKGAEDLKRRFPMLQIKVYDAAGFGGGFDVHRCDLVVRRIGSDRGLRIPFPQH